MKISRYMGVLVFAQFFLYIYLILGSMRMYDGNEWLHESFSHLGTQDGTQTFFTVFLLILSFCGYLYAVGSIIEVVWATKINKQEWKSAVASAVCFYVGFVLLAVAAIFPTNLDNYIHEICGALFFLLYPIGMLMFSRVIERNFASVAKITRYVAVFALVGEVILFIPVKSAIPSELLFELVMGMWIILLNVKVLSQLDSKK